jgi:hypothetical protein
MATKKITCAPPPSPRAKAMTAIDAEVKKLTAVKAAYEAEIARLEAKHQGQWTSDDWADYQELPSKVEQLRKQLRGLRERRIEVEAGPENAVDPRLIHGEPQKAAPGRKPGRKWTVRKGLREPKFPADAMMRGDRKAVEKAQEAFQEFYIADIEKVFSESGSPPDERVRLDEIAVVVGSFNAIKNWLTGWIRMLEQRLAAVEESGLKYAGVHQPAQTYPKGAVVTHAGSTWIATTAVPEGITPGQRSASGRQFWQLAVKGNG